MNRVELAVAAVPAVTGMAAKHLETGQELGHLADDLFFTASTFKVPILVELYRQVDQSIVDPASRLELTDEVRSPGGGTLKELDSGLRLTIHDLAMLMIIVSDNTATDMLYNLVGRDPLNDTMRKLGLLKTSLPMTCKELLYSMYGVDTDDIFEGTRLVADALAHGRTVPGSDGLSEERSDVSSPRDMVRLLEMLYRGELLSEESTAAAMDILERQQAATIIPYGLPPGTRNGPQDRRRDQRPLRRGHSLRGCLKSGGRVLTASASVSSWHCRSTPRWSPAVLHSPCSADGSVPAMQMFSQPPIFAATPRTDGCLSDASQSPAPNPIQT